MADHPQTVDRLVAREMSAAAIQYANTSAIKLVQAIVNGVDFIVHQAEKDPANQKVEARKRNQSDRCEVGFARIRLKLAPFFQDVAAKQFVQGTAGSG